MFEVTNCYREFVLKPLIKEIKRLESKVRSKNIFTWCFRGIYIRRLEKLEKLLVIKYQDFEELMDTKLDFKNK